MINGRTASAPWEIPSLRRRIWIGCVEGGHGFHAGDLRQSDLHAQPGRDSDTGCSGFQNGVFDFGRKFVPDIALWPRTMQHAGYRTWYVGKWHNDGRPTERGFDRTNGLFTGGGGKWWGNADYPQHCVDYNGRTVTGYRGWVFQTDERKLSAGTRHGLACRRSAVRSPTPRLN